MNTGIYSHWWQTWFDVQLSVGNPVPVQTLETIVDDVQLPTLARAPIHHSGQEQHAVTVSALQIKPEKLSGGWKTFLSSLALWHHEGRDTRVSQTRSERQTRSFVRQSLRPPLNRRDEHLGTGFLVWSPCPRIFSKKKSISLHHPFLHILFINKHTHAPHSRTSHGKLPTKLGSVSFSLYRTLYTTNHFSFLLF